MLIRLNYLRPMQDPKGHELQLRHTMCDLETDQRCSKKKNLITLHMQRYTRAPVHTNC